MDMLSEGAGEKVDPAFEGELECDEGGGRLFGEGADLCNPELTEPGIGSSLGAMLGLDLRLW